jgi:hypothetical protein
MKAFTAVPLVLSLMAVAWGGYVSLAPQAPPPRPSVTQGLPAAHTSLLGEKRSDEALSNHAEDMPQHHRTLRQEMARLKATLAAIHQRLDDLAPVLPELAALRQRLHTLTTVAQETGPGAADQTPIPGREQLERDEAQQHAAAQQQWRDDMATIEASLQHEAVDPSWAAHAVDRIAQATAHAELAALSVLDVDCRATLCRMEVAQDDPEIVQQWLARFVAHVVDTLPTLTVVPAEEGADRLVLVLTRVGYGLPARGQGW